MTPITNHIQQALDKLIDRYKNKPRIAAWCASHVRQVQKAEDAIQALVTLLDVDSADLARLTLPGKLVGQPQRGTLDQFRLYVKTRIFANRSRGTIPDVLHVGLLLLGDMTVIEGGANLLFEAQTPLAGRDSGASYSFMSSAKAGGVGLRLVTFEGVALELASGSDYVTDDARALTPTSFAYGGNLAISRGPGDPVE